MFKNTLSTLSAACTVAKNEVQAKVQVVKDAHTVKKALTPEQKANMKTQAEMVKAFQVALLHEQAEVIRAQKNTVDFAGAYQEAYAKVSAS